MPPPEGREDGFDDESPSIERGARGKQKASPLSGAGPAGGWAYESDKVEDDQVLGVLGRRVL